MVDNTPDHDLADRMVLTRSDQVRAVGDPLRTMLLQLLHDQAATAFQQGKLWGSIRHARLREDQVSQFWERTAARMDEFDRLPRSGDTTYGFAIGLYPTSHPTLPKAD